MTSPKDSTSFFEPDDRDRKTERLLRLAMNRPNLVAEELRRKIEAKEGSRWFESVLHTDPLGLFRDLDRGDGSEETEARPIRLLSGDVTIEQLRAIKEKSKALFRATRDPDQRLIGAVGYFLSIAAGLRHHHTRICSRSRQEVDPILLDLASAAPSPWNELLSRAAIEPEPDSSPESD